jgi:hypothetical protein
MVGSNLVEVLFLMKIDPSIFSSPFANVGFASFYQNEEEILFSMQRLT